LTLIAWSACGTTTLSDPSSSAQVQTATEQQDADPLCALRERFFSYATRFDSSDTPATAIRIESLPYAENGTWKWRDLPVQWFNHAGRVEHHEEHVGTAYEVQGGRYGAEYLARLMMNLTGRNTSTYDARWLS